MSSSSVPAAQIPRRLEAFAREVSRTYATTAWPEPEIYSVMADALRLCRAGAARYTDWSCVELHEEELEAEGRKKLLQLFQGREADTGKKTKARPPLLETIATRGELFKMLATCLNNHFRGLVHKHRFTAKRTGQKAPPKGSAELETWRRDHQKSSVSLDANPEVRSQIEFHSHALNEGSTPGQMTPEEEDDLSEMCTPFEWSCYTECVTPSDTAWCLAYVDGHRGKKAGDPLSVTLRDEHRAAALGIELSEYTAAMKSVFSKLLALRSGYKDNAPAVSTASVKSRESLTSLERMVYQQVQAPNAAALALAKAAHAPKPQTEHLAAGLGLESGLFNRLVLSVKTKLMDTPPVAISALETIFQVQVPRDVSSVIVRRLFTLAVREACAEREHIITPEVVELLKQIGVEVPAKGQHGVLGCFGALFSRSHPVCNQCQARTACQARAANVGLDQVTLRPDALAAPARTMVRVPTVIVAEPAPVVAPVVAAPAPVVPQSSERAEAMRAHLDFHYRREQNGPALAVYSHKGSPSRQIAEVGTRTGEWTKELNPAFLVRICNPSPAIRKKLVQVSRSFYLPEAMPVAEARKLIDEHAHWLYSQPQGIQLPTIPDLAVSRSAQQSSPVQQLLAGARHAAHQISTLCRYLTHKPALC